MKMIIYLCDPDKNKNCSKTGCYIHDGPCECTTNSEFALHDENGKPIICEEVNDEQH